jgi:hypothetical protein
MKRILKNYIFKIFKNTQKNYSFTPIDPETIKQFKKERKIEHLEFNKILERNKQWAKKKIEQEPGYFLEKSKQQTPKYLFIG